MPITKKTPVGDVVKDFYKSDAPQFKGKSKKKRREMAVAASLSKKNNKKMTKEELKELVKKTIDEKTYGGAKAVDDMKRDPNFRNIEDQPGAIKTLQRGGTIELGETSQTPKYDNNPSLKGGQKNLPDPIQKGIIDAARERGVKSGVITYMPNEKGEFERTDTGTEDPMKVSMDKLLKRLKRLEDEERLEDKAMTEDLDIGHQDDEAGMLVADLYRINKYSGELCDMIKELGQLDGEVDFPHWWQAKVIKARDYMVSAKHYLDGELKTGQAFGND